MQKRRAGLLISENPCNLSIDLRQRLAEFQKLNDPPMRHHDALRCRKRKLTLGRGNQRNAVGFGHRAGA